MSSLPQNQTDSLGTESIGRLMFRLAMPAIAAQIINLLYNLVDRMYIGHIEGIGRLALTGVGVCLPILMIVSAFAAFVSMGAAPRTSILLGKNDKDGAEKILGNSFVLLLIIAVAITAILLFFSRDMLMVFGASENTIEYSMEYMTIYSLGTIFVQMTLGLNAFITAQGFAKTSMLTVLIGAIANIILDPIFIFVFDMGVRGAALATIISQCLSMIWILHFLTGKKTTINIRKKFLKLDPKIFMPCLALGLAPFIMQSTESLLAICFNSSLLKYGGDLAVGAMTILTSVIQLSMLPLQGLSQGAQPIMSYNFGARNAARVRSAFKLLLISSLVYSTLFWALVELFPNFFVLIFNNEPGLVEFASRALRIYFVCSFLLGIQIACQQSFIALGDAKSSLAAALMRKIILLIPLIYIMPSLGIFSDKTSAVFAAEPIADALAVAFTAILFSIRFKKAMAEIDPQSNHRFGLFYRFVRGGIRLFTPKMKTIWAEPYGNRPSIFVCTHDRAYGPIAMCAHFDKCEVSRPWINAQMLHSKELPAYVRNDYWWNPSKWYSHLFGYTLPYLLATVLPALLRGSDCIPVRHDTGVMATMRRSVRYMNDGINLMLFPEQPSGFGTYSDTLFNGYVSIARLLYSNSQKIVDFYPCVIDWKSKTISIGKAQPYDPEAIYDQQVESITKYVQSYFEKNRPKKLELDI